MNQRTILGLGMIAILACTPISRAQAPGIPPAAPGMAAPTAAAESPEAAAAEALSRFPILQDDNSDKKLLKYELSPSADPVDYYKKVAQLPTDQIVASARAVLVSLKEAGKVQPAGMTVGGGAGPTNALV